MGRAFRVVKRTAHLTVQVAEKPSKIAVTGSDSEGTPKRPRGAAPKRAKTGAKAGRKTTAETRKKTTSKTSRAKAAAE